jgi:pilus assembly protein CpaC
VATAVELGDGQSFAIAGLLRDDIVGLTDAYPIVGKIPVIGALARSSQFQKRQSELVIIVTPHLIKPLSPDQLSLPTDHFVEPTKAEFYFLGALEGRVRVEEAQAQSGPDAGETSKAMGGPASVTFIGDVGHRISATNEETE